MSKEEEDEEVPDGVFSPTRAS